MADFRALCAELTDTLDYWLKNSNLTDSDARDLVEEARAALAQPEPQEPTDDELGKLLYYEFTTSTGHGERVDAMGFARAVLARWGNQ
jgi:hypothetical protein